MEKSNVIVLGPSGVGKSTLINAVVGEEIGTSLEPIKPYEATPEIQVHECEGYDFRLIDTVGFEPGAAKQKKAVELVQKWTRDGAKKQSDIRSLDLVWYCIDGTSRRVFTEYIRDVFFPDSKGGKKEKKPRKIETKKKKETKKTPRRG